jgi:hypothetical protein
MSAVKEIRTPFFRSIRAKLLIGFLLLALVPLAVAGTLAYARARDALRAAAFAHLQAVGAGRREAIDVAFDLHAEMLQMIAAMPEVPEVLGDGNNPPDPTSDCVAQLNDELRAMQAASSRYLSLHVLDAGGTVVSSTDGDLLGQPFADLYAAHRITAAVQVHAET